MKQGTVVRHLAEMAEVASTQLRWRGEPPGWPLSSLWAAGAVLGSGEEDTEVVLALDLPADDLPWLAQHPDGEWVGEVLRLGKRPLLWTYRSAAGPAWNARHRRVVRFWTDDDGVDEEVLDALRRREPAVDEPSLDDWQAQLRDERVIAARHLRTVLDSYRDPAWRREHKGFDRYPEDHLWFAAQGLREIEDALGG